MDKTMSERKILEEAFKKEFGDNWQNEMRDFEHGFPSFYDASINAISQALGEKCSGCNSSTGETKLWCCNHCGKRIEDF
jgi:uncharacterized UBP type Zn finger protein